MRTRRQGLLQFSKLARKGLRGVHMSLTVQSTTSMTRTLRQTVCPLMSSNSLANIRRDDGKRSPFAFFNILHYLNRCKDFLS